MKENLSEAFPSYIKTIHKFPMLDADEERRLTKLWQETKDKKAADVLVNSHLRLVSKIATGYRGYGIPLEELLSEGTVGIMEGLKRFDPDKGARFSTYVSWWIHASLKDYVLRSWSLVRIGTTAAQKKLFFGLRRIKARLDKLEMDTSPEDAYALIADELNVSQKDVMEMEKRLSGGDYSLNAPLADDREGEWQDWLEDESEDQEKQFGNRQEHSKRRELLDYGLRHLNPREQHIFCERYLKEKPTTLSVIANEYGLSRERIRQIEMRSMEKVTQAIKRKSVEMRLH